MKNKTINTKWLIIAITGLLLLTACRSKNEESEQVIEKDPRAELVEQLRQTERPKADFSKINGYWESDKREDGAYLHFTIDYPKVLNFDGNEGQIGRAENSKYLYSLYLLDGDESVMFYINELSDSTAKIWYQDKNGKYTNSLALTRTVEPEEAVIEKDSEQKPNTVSNTQKPSVSSNTATAVTPDTNQNSSSGKGHWEERTVLVKDAYDEQVLVQKGACTDVLVQAAYDTEELVYGDGAYYGPDQEMVAWCYICNHITDSHCDDQGHPFSNKYIDVSEPYWHNVSYQTVHHDAVYETRCEPDVYKTVHHDAEYKTEKVWIED